MEVDYSSTISPNSLISLLKTRMCDYLPDVPTCITGTPGSSGSQKRVWEPMGQKQQIAVSCHLGPGDQLCVRSLNH